MSRTVRTETHALHSVLKSESWSMSCSAPRPCGEKPKIEKKKKGRFGPFNPLPPSVSPPDLLQRGGRPPDEQQR